MHAIYFRWKVAAGRERDFEHAWLELTALVRDERGGLGSRLHRCADGHYFAYAQWPSELAWATQPAPGARMVELRDRMRACAELVDGPLRGDVVADLLISAAPAPADGASIDDAGVAFGEPGNGAHRALTSLHKNHD